MFGVNEFLDKMANGIPLTKDMKIYTKEVFGPVIPIIKFETLDETIEMANDRRICIYF